MKWVADKLAAGENVTFRPKGRSMEPLVKHNQEVTLVPYVDQSISLGDVVLCKVSGRVYLHRVTAIDGDRYQIGNNKGHINGWTRTIYGILEK